MACVAAAWKQWAQDRTTAREGDTRGERERLPGRLTNSHSVSASVGREAPERRSNGAGRENCQSKGIHEGKN